MFVFAYEMQYSFPRSIPQFSENSQMDLSKEIKKDREGGSIVFAAKEAMERASAQLSQLNEETKSDPSTPKEMELDSLFNEGLEVIEEIDESLSGGETSLLESRLEALLTSPIAGLVIQCCTFCLKYRRTHFLIDSNSSRDL